MTKIGILGAGKLGQAIARGLVKQGLYQAQDILLMRRSMDELLPLSQEGFQTSTQAARVILDCPIVLICVLPQQLNALLDDCAALFEVKKPLIISTVTGVSIAHLRQRLGADLNIVRAMPNTAVAVGQSMTCIASDRSDAVSALLETQRIFEAVGKTLVIAEEQMQAATALCACGIAFFLRAIRAASQGGIEIGFHAEDALLMAAQTALGASSLLLHAGHHPEHEIDQVTSPQGCTITGLNQMEHHGFSSAMIRGIVSSAQKAGMLFPKGD